MIPTILGLRYRHDALLSCRVSTGGGMLGGRSEIALSRDADGIAVLRVSGKAQHNEREVTTEYRVDDAAFDHIRELVNEYHLYAASLRPYSRMTVLDADTTTISFGYKSGDFSVSERKVLSRKMRTGFSETEAYLQSLAVGESVTTKEAQRATLHLRSGFTLQFIVEDAFDGKMDAILSEERDVSAFLDCGIVLAVWEEPDLAGAEPAGTNAQAGTIVYDPDSGQIILLHAVHTFPQPVYLIAQFDGDVASASPLIAEMEGAYSLYLN